MKKILFIVEGYIYENDGYKARIVMELELLQRYFDLFMFVTAYQKELDLPGSIKVYKYPHKKNMLPYIFNFYNLRKYLSSLLSGLGEVIVYCEALPAAIMALPVCRANNFNLVYDCHGAAAAEAYLYRHNWIGYLYSKWLESQERKVLNFATLVVTVSQIQAEIFSCDDKSVLLPMLPGKIFFDKQSYRNEIRKKLNIKSEDVVFVYAGQNQKWQMAEETMRVYKEIEKQNMNTRLLILTNAVKEFNIIANKCQINEPIALKAAYEDVPKYLDACDFGFCLRNNNIINRVSSPTKVLEYVSRDVVPILTPYVGDFSKELDGDKIAYVIDMNTIKDFEFKRKNINGRLYVKKRVNECVKTYINALSLIR